MVYDYRWPLDGRFGVLLDALTTSATTMRSWDFQYLSHQLSPSLYQAAIITDDTPYKYEIVWLTGHTADSDTVTMVRGREGTTAQAWPANAIWRTGPTIRDAVGVTTRSGLAALTDQQMGARYTLSDEEQTLTKASGTWQSGAPYRASRKQGFIKSALFVEDGLTLQVTPWQASDDNPEGLATVSGPNFTLNLEGVWSISAQAQGDFGATLRTQHFHIDWVNGPWTPTGTVLAVKDTGQVGYPSCGAIHQYIGWCGYVSPTAAAAPFSLKLYNKCHIPSGILFDFWITLEYLGL